MEHSDILELDSKRHVKMWLLHKRGLSRRQIAELLGGTNPGAVGNEVKKYEKDVARQKAAESMIHADKKNKSSDKNSRIPNYANKTETEISKMLKSQTDFDLIRFARDLKQSTPPEFINALYDEIKHRGGSPTFKKRRRSALDKGAAVEAEHSGLYDKLAERLKEKGVAMPMSREEFFKEIAREHLAEKKDYYDLLEKYVEKHSPKNPSPIVKADPEAVFKAAVLRKFGLSESDIVPAGKHSHKFNYNPGFSSSEKGIGFEFSTGQTTDWSKGGTWTEYGGYALSTPYRGEYSVGVYWSKHKNSHTNDIISEKWLVDEKFKSWEEAKERFLTYFGLPSNLMGRGGKTEGNGSGAEGGGLLVGVKHTPSGAGINVQTPEGKLKVEGGEIIINAAASKKYCKELSEMNQSVGDGVAFPCDHPALDGVQGPMAGNGAKTGGPFYVVFDLGDGIQTEEYETRAAANAARREIIAEMRRELPEDREMMKPYVISQAEYDADEMAGDGAKLAFNAPHLHLIGRKVEVQDLSRGVVDSMVVADVHQPNDILIIDLAGGAKFRSYKAYIPVAKIKEFESGARVELKDSNAKIMLVKNAGKGGQVMPNDDEFRVSIFPHNRGVSGKRPNSVSMHVPIAVQRFLGSRDIVISFDEHSLRMRAATSIENGTHKISGKGSVSITGEAIKDRIGNFPGAIEGDYFVVYFSESYGAGGQIPVAEWTMPDAKTYIYAESIRKNHPEIWRAGGNEFGNTAYENLTRVLKRGYWLKEEEKMYKRWRSFIARHQHDKRLAGVVANLKWLNYPNIGEAAVRELIDDAIKFSSKKPELNGNGGQVREKMMAEYDALVEELSRANDAQQRIRNAEGDSMAYRAARMRYMKLNAKRLALLQKIKGLAGHGYQLGTRISDGKKPYYLLSREEVIAERDALEANWENRTSADEQRMKNLQRYSFVAFKTLLPELK